MGQTSTQREILLMTGTSFTSRQWSIKDESPDKNNKSEKERLEEACWFGVVKEILPELFHQSANEEKVFLWQIMEGKSFLELDMGESPFEKDRFFSIDPYSFLNEIHFN
jgi:hypothetical protein